jgi:hypothetical protein
MMRSTPLRRTAFKAKPKAWAQPERAPRTVPTVVPGMFRLAQPVVLTAAPKAKREPIRDEHYRRLVAALPCARCGIHGFSQAAHPNEGKAKGAKADDTLCFPLCCTRPGVPGCHVDFDQYRLGTRAESIEMGRAWGAETAEQIKSAGLWPERLPFPSNPER